jgi:hypothetical protein
VPAARSRLQALRRQFRPGTAASFDRFTSAAQNLHEIEPAARVRNLDPARH